MPQVDFPVIPENITVHLGPPGAQAENITVPFIDYVKNATIFMLPHFSVCGKPRFVCF